MKKILPSILLFAWAMLGQAADQGVIDSIKKKGGLVLQLQGEAEQWEVQFQLGGRDLDDAGLADAVSYTHLRAHET